MFTKKDALKIKTELVVIKGKIKDAVLENDINRANTLEKIYQSKKKKYGINCSSDLDPIIYGDNNG